MRFDGTNWVNVGNAGFSEMDAYNTSLAFSPADGQPYVAFVDVAHGVGATVMKLVGNGWQNVGSLGFSSSNVNYISLAINSSGQPYVAYMDLGPFR